MKKQLNKIYLAIPYSKMNTDLSFQLANEISVYFLKQGNNVFSPITHCHPLHQTGMLNDNTWEFWGEIDMQFIDWADEIIVIIPPTTNGVDLVLNSTGVTSEIKYGLNNNKPHRFFDYKTKSFVEIEEFVL